MVDACQDLTNFDQNAIESNNIEIYYGRELEVPETVNLNDVELVTAANVVCDIPQNFVNESVDPISDGSDNEAIFKLVPYSDHSDSEYDNEETTPFAAQPFEEANLHRENNKLLNLYVTVFTAKLKRKDKPVDVQQHCRAEEFDNESSVADKSPKVEKEYAKCEKGQNNTTFIAKATFYILEIETLEILPASCPEFATV
ncbi:hypothetical protein FQA39_LY02451 [Lamprigera yunnana]|nr:hypothetical protein FQA39_LY02451 [Lamprigera yunnana]